MKTEFPNCCSKCGLEVETTIYGREVCPKCGELDKANDVELIHCDKFKQVAEGLISKE